MKPLFYGAAVAQLALCWVPGLAGRRGIAGDSRAQNGQQPSAV